MKTTGYLYLPLVGLGCLALQPVLAGPVAEPEVQPAASQGDFTGSITTKLYGFDYFDAPGHSGYTYLDRYNVRKGYNGNYRSGFYADVDFDLNYAYGDDKSLSVTRWGEGFYRHGGELLWDEEAFALTSYYNFLRTTTGSLGYQFSPNVVEGLFGPNVGVDSRYNPTNANTNSGFLSRNNFDSSDTDYFVDRFSYGANFQIKPGALGEKTRIDIAWDGYLRDGLAMQSYVLGGSDLSGGSGGTRVNERWRTYSRDVDENMNRFTLKVQASPGDWFDINYLGSYERFDNRVRTAMLGDLTPIVSPPYTVTNPTRPVGYIPDASRLTNSLNLKRQFGDHTNVSAGYLDFRLKQESFPSYVSAQDYNTGEIVNQEAFINFDTSFTPVFGMEGEVRWAQRENNSTFPAGTLTNINLGQTLGTRINDIESWDTDLAALVRPEGWGSTFALGWRHMDKSRDLTYSSITPAEIHPGVSLYRTDTVYDEMYLRWSALNWNGYNFRVTGVYRTADETGLVTDPEEVLGLKSAVTYTAENGLVWSAYYNYRSAENNDLRFNDKVAPLLSYAQDVSNTLQSAGAMVSYNPSKDLNLYAGFDWMQMDADLLYFESKSRRFEANTVFEPGIYTDSTIDVYMLTFGGDYQLSENLKLLASYTMTLSDGNLASGDVADELATVDDSLDNVLHTFSLGAAYDIDDTKQLVVGYQFDYYEDDSYANLSAGAHSLMTGLRFQF
ncbi:MAG: hypothetical protein Q8Q59_10255 [Luteolibacter sp.]|jgi:hypothetical protein|nr:hypothetical protein [Luteolibacter sp.]